MFRTSVFFQCTQKIIFVFVWGNILWSSGLLSLVLRVQLLAGLGGSGGVIKIVPKLATFRPGSHLPAVYTLYRFLDVLVRVVFFLGGGAVST